ncbi:hypothetical protein IFU40_15850 [Microbacterium sp. CFBP 13617]|nr:hypothetical protein [Microbacterium sp. CFBP 13617]
MEDATSPRVPQSSPTESTSSADPDLPNEAQPVSPEADEELAIGPEEAFLDAARNGWQGQEASESTWIELGNNACSELETGKPLEEIYIVGEDSDAARSNNSLIVTEAQKNLCPQFG